MLCGGLVTGFSSDLYDTDKKLARVIDTAQRNKFRFYVSKNKKNYLLNTRSFKKLDQDFLENIFVEDQEVDQSSFVFKKINAFKLLGVSLEKEYNIFLKRGNKVYYLDQEKNIRKYDARTEMGHSRIGSRKNLFIRHRFSPYLIDSSFVYLTISGRTGYLTTLSFGLSPSYIYKNRYGVWAELTGLILPTSGKDYLFIYNLLAHGQLFYQYRYFIDVGLGVQKWNENFGKILSISEQSLVYSFGFGHQFLDPWMGVLDRISFSRYEVSNIDYLKSDGSSIFRFDMIFSFF